jgi:uncharacterized membrane-anchored protein
MITKNLRTATAAKILVIFAFALPSRYQTHIVGATVKTIIKFIFISILFTHYTSHANPQAPENAFRELNWVKAPNNVKIAERATIQLQGEQLYLDSANTNKFLKLNGNLPRDDSYTIATSNGSWFAIFDFNPSGYIKDDEEINSTELLNTLKANNERSLEERKKQGLPLLYLQGWHTPPHYDKDTKRLEWAINIKDEQGNPIINYTTRILGKSGYMSATLVSDPATLDKDIKSFKNVLKSFSYIDGERYSEWREGDKVAAYGLGALVVGGAAAAVASKGGFKFLWALALAAFAAIGAFLKRVFGKKE